MDYKSISKIGIYLPIQLCYLMVFGLASLDKFLNFSGNVSYFTKLFSKTFLVKLPGGMAPHVAGIGIAEGLIAVLMAIAILKREFLPSCKMPLLTRFGLLASSFMFVALGFGLRLAQDYGNAANLFFYFALTQLLYISLVAMEKD